MEDDSLMGAEETVEENLFCRDVVREIMHTGVSQRQIYFIMYLLSLELENIEHCQTLAAILREMKEDTHLADHPTNAADLFTGAPSNKEEKA